MTSHLKGLLHMPKRDSFVKWGLTLFTAIILAGLSVCVYWVLLDRKVPIDVHKGEVILYQKQIDDSWVFVVRWTGTLRRRCGGISNRWIVDGFRLSLVDIPYPAEAEPTQLNEEFTWEVPVHVPSYFVSTGHSSGQYRARFLYGCNPLQERMFPIVDTPPSVHFELPIEKQPATGPGQNLAPPPPKK
jgi:hypothetical protein